MIINALRDVLKIALVVGSISLSGCYNDEVGDSPAVEIETIPEAEAEAPSGFSLTTDSETNLWESKSRKPDAITAKTTEKAKDAFQKMMSSMAKISDALANNLHKFASAESQATVERYGKLLTPNDDLVGEIELGSTNFLLKTKNLRLPIEPTADYPYFKIKSLDKMSYGSRACTGLSGGQLDGDSAQSQIGFQIGDRLFKLSTTKPKAFIAISEFVDDKCQQRWTDYRHSQIDPYKKASVTSVGNRLVMLGSNTQGKIVIGSFSSDNVQELPIKGELVNHHALDGQLVLLINSEEGPVVAWCDDSEYCWLSQPHESMEASYHGRVDDTHWLLRDHGHNEITLSACPKIDATHCLRDDHWTRTEKISFGNRGPIDFTSSVSGLAIAGPAPADSSTEVQFCELNASSTCAPQPNLALSGWRKLNVNGSPHALSLAATPSSLYLAIISGGRIHLSQCKWNECSNVTKWQRVDLGDVSGTPRHLKMQIVKKQIFIFSHDGLRSMAWHCAIDQNCLDENSWVRQDDILHGDAPVKLVSTSAGELLVARTSDGGFQYIPFKSPTHFYQVVPSDVQVDPGPYRMQNMSLGHLEALTLGLTDYLAVDEEKKKESWLSDVTRTVIDLAIDSFKALTPAKQKIYTSVEEDIDPIERKRILANWRRLIAIYFDQLEDLQVFFGSAGVKKHRERITGMVRSASSTRQDLSELAGKLINDHFASEIEEVGSKVETWAMDMQALADSASP